VSVNYFFRPVALIGAGQWHSIPGFSARLRAIGIVEDQAAVQPVHSVYNELFQLALWNFGPIGA
jgi:hypothetical protein